MERMPLMRTALTVTVEWSQISSMDDPKWDDDSCLYAYLNPQDQAILYIGKTKTGSVRRRWHGVHKSRLFEAILREHGVEADDVHVLRGSVAPKEGSNLTKRLLGDVEGLLIRRLSPWGNINQPRITRAMRVSCEGDWPHRRDQFRYYPSED